MDALEAPPVTLEAFPVAHPRAYVRRGSFSESRTDRRTGARTQHGAVDIGAPEGSVIVSASSGRVVRVLDDAAANCGFGVIIRDRSSGRRYTYCHMMAIPPLREGETVEPGQLLGYVGSTGRSDGPHLHMQAVDLQTGERVDLTPELVELQRIARGRPSQSAPAVPRRRSGGGGFLLVLAVLWAIKGNRA